MARLKSSQNTGTNLVNCCNDTRYSPSMECLIVLFYTKKMIWINGCSRGKEKFNRVRKVEERRNKGESKTLD
jgi:hypothetical protein